MFDEQIIQTAAYVGQNFYSTPYSNTAGSLFRANFYYTCADGTIIHRPNHNIVNSLRRLVYLQPIIDYYKINGTDDIKKQLASLDEAEIAKIRYVLLFYTAGREDESNSSETRSKSKVSENMEAYFTSCQSFAPFNDLDEVKHYAQLVLKNYTSKGENDKIIALIIESCHYLDLLRCFPDYKLQNSLFKTFNKHSNQKNTRNLQSLIFYAQNCILTTGDKLRTQYQVQDVHGSYQRQAFYLHLKPSQVKPIKTGNNAIVLGAKGYAEVKFKASSQVDEEGIRKTLENLEQVPKPIFFPKKESSNAYTATTALALIQEGNAAIRIINGSTNSCSLRFELEQLVNPHFMRPLRKRKLKKDHTQYYDGLTAETVTRSEKDYTELSQQISITRPPDSTLYQNNKPVSKQSDRAKPKQTIFTKKQSYSLLPSNGIFSLFKGRLEYRMSRPFISIGTLHNLNQMHLKGERYIWPEDVKSSGIKNGYFWLPGETKQRPSSSMPKSLSISELKTRLQDNEKNCRFNEMLLGASLDSLTALFATKDNRLYRLAALHANILLSFDYGITRPLLIITGKSPPKEYTHDQMKEDITHALKKYHKWYWRLLRPFVSTKEQQLLSEIKRLIGFGDGYKVSDNEIMQYFSKNETDISGLTDLAVSSHTQVDLKATDMAQNAFENSETIENTENSTSALNTQPYPPTDFFNNPRNSKIPNQTPEATASQTNQSPDSVNPILETLNTVKTCIKK